MSKKKPWIAPCALFVTIFAGCSAAPEEARSSSTSAAVCGASVGAGQCLASVQSFYQGFGVTVGVAPSEGATDAEGRWCAAEGACLIWVLDIPSRFGWERTSSPQAFDIAVFPPNGGNAWGHITIVDHVDGAGVWMVDSNDDFQESPNNVPHLHQAAPYGFYHYSGAAALGCGGGGPPPADPPPADPPAPSPAPAPANCAGYNDALYCGANYVNGDPNVLYRCTGGVASVEQICPNGCQSMPDGSDDRCP